MGFGHAASVQALIETHDNLDVAASLLADIGDAILTQPQPADTLKTPSKFAALLIKPNIICLIVDALRAFSLRVSAECLMCCHAVLEDLTQVLVEEASALLAPLPQMGEPLGMKNGEIADSQLRASSTMDPARVKDHHVRY